MKFIHTGDIHWGMTPDADKIWSKERAQSIKNTLAQIVSRARDLNVDFLFITGDLFHRQPLTRELKEVNYLFSTIPSTRVIIIAGSNDRIRPNSVVLNFSWNPNVTFFMDEKISSVSFDDVNTELYGFSYHSSEITDSMIDHLKIPDNGKIHILLAYGGDEKHMPFSRHTLSYLPFSYIALGSSHKHEIIAENQAAYCGSPEPLSKSETGEHGMIIGTIDDHTKKVSSLEFVPLSSAQYIPLMIHVTADTTNSELCLKLHQEIQKRGNSNIYRIRISGMRNPDTSFDLSSLTSHLRIIEINDETEPQYDFNALFSEHSNDMIGFYICHLKKDDMSPVEKKALYYGINALLHTKKERN